MYVRVGSEVIGLDMETDCEEVACKCTGVVISKLHWIRLLGHNTSTAHHPRARVRSHCITSP